MAIGFARLATPKNRRQYMKEENNGAAQMLHHIHEMKRPVANDGVGRRNRGSYYR
jgi:hypothetical protein